MLSQEYIWFTRGDEELGTLGAQIGLLIERRDRIINICEIKFSSDEEFMSGDFVKIKVTGSYEYDLIGELL